MQSYDDDSEKTYLYEATGPKTHTTHISNTSRAIFGLIIFKYENLCINVVFDMCPVLQIFVLHNESS